MSKYSNGKIYKLHSYDNELIYIGSTVQTLSQRYGGHKANFKKNQNTTSKILFQQSENVIITLIKLFPCNCRGELEAEERKYIQNIECVNKNIPNRTQKEWYHDNQELMKEYRQNNRDKQQIYQQVYRQSNKLILSEQQKEYYRNNKKMLSDKKKRYYQHNKKMLSDQKKRYYQHNKENVKHSYYWRCNPQLFDKIKPLFYDI